MLVVDSWGWQCAEDRGCVKALGAHGIEGPGPYGAHAVTVEVAWKSFRNLPTVHVLTAGELNAYDVLARTT